MLENLHHHRLNGWHFDQWKALLQQLLKLSISVGGGKGFTGFTPIQSF